MCTDHDSDVAGRGEVTVERGPDPFLDAGVRLQRPQLRLPRHSAGRQVDFATGPDLPDAACAHSGVVKPRKVFRQIGVEPGQGSWTLPARPPGHRIRRVEKASDQRVHRSARHRKSLCSRTPRGSGRRARPVAYYRGLRRIRCTRPGLSGRRWGACKEDNRREPWIRSSGILPRHRALSEPRIAVHAAVGTASNVGATAPPPGFEPEPLEPKSKVLPLHHGGSRVDCLTSGRRRVRPRALSSVPRRVTARWTYAGGDNPSSLGGGFLS